jgi:hypothetical protein
VSNYLSIERLAIIKILAVYDPAEKLSPKEMSALNDFLNALVVEGPVREDIKRYYDLTAKLSRIEGEFVPTFEELVETITRIKERQESDFNSVPELGF